MSKGHNRIRPSSQGKGKKEKDMAQNEVIETEKVTVEDTCKAIREKADNYVKKLNEEEDDVIDVEAEELASEEATEEVEEAVEVKNIYCRFYCYDGTERANVQDVKISQKQMEEILAIINR